MADLVIPLNITEGTFKFEVTLDMEKGQMTIKEVDPIEFVINGKELVGILDRGRRDYGKDKKG